MLASLYRKLHEFQNFKSECVGLVTDLKKVISPLTLADRNIDSYKYNDTRADAGKLLKSKNKLSEIITNLENVIIPELDRNIKSINNEIEIEEAREAMEEII